MTPNLTDATLYQGDPHPTYRWLRANAPVYRDEASNLWVLSKYEDVLQASKDAATFSAGQGVLPESDAMISIVCMDDPRHQRELRGWPDRAADADRIVRSRRLPSANILQRLGTIELLDRIVDHHLEAFA